MTSQSITRLNAAKEKHYMDPHPNPFVRKLFDKGYVVVSLSKDALTKPNHIQTAISQIRCNTRSLAMAS